MKLGKDWHRPSNQKFYEMYGGGPETTFDPIRQDERNQKIIMDIALDTSGSMAELYPTLIECFNDIMIPSFGQVVDKYAKTLRVGAAAFSDRIIPVWDGFRSIEGLRGRKLSMDTIDATGKGCTALYRTMIESLKQSATAAQRANGSGHKSAPAKIKICILTDGRNNLEPQEVSSVKAITDTILDRQQVQLVLAYFDTTRGDGNGGLSRDEFQAMTKATGFSDATYYFDLKNKTGHERSRDFRRNFGIISEYLTNKGL